VANPLTGVVISGLPTHLDGAPVYQLWQKDKWAAESASFLLAGYKFGLANPCPSAAATAAATSGGPTDGELIPTCDGVELSPTSNNYTKDEQELAPFGSQALAGLTDGTAVVVRGHTRDPLSARCTDHGRSACEAALVVEDVVWQGSPDSRVAPDHDAFYDPVADMSITVGGFAAGSGTKVYGPGEDLPTSGSFLISGQMARSPASCDATPVPSAPIVWPICGIWSVAGHQMVETGVDLDSLLGHEVILRVYGAGSTTVCASGEERCRVLAAVEVVWVT
jgi:hypothetical protein